MHYKKTEIDNRWTLLYGDERSQHLKYVYIQIIIHKRFDYGNIRLIDCDWSSITAKLGKIRY